MEAVKEAVTQVLEAWNLIQAQYPDLDLLPVDFCIVTLAKKCSTATISLLISQFKEENVIVLLDHVLDYLSEMRSKDLENPSNEQSALILLDILDGLPTSFQRSHLMKLVNWCKQERTFFEERQSIQRASSSGTKPKKRKTTTPMSTTPVDSQGASADAPGDEDSLSDDAINEFFTQHLAKAKVPSNKAISLDGCNIFAKMGDKSYTWKAAKCPSLKRYIQFNVYPSIQDLKDTQPMEHWRRASFRGKVAVGSPLKPHLWKRTKAAIEEMQQVIILNAEELPTVAISQALK